VLFPDAIRLTPLESQLAAVFAISSQLETLLSRSRIALALALVLSAMMLEGTVECATELSSFWLQQKEWGRLRYDRLNRRSRFAREWAGAGTLIPSRGKVSGCRISFHIGTKTAGIPVTLFRSRLLLV
jgi:hypothetical protein